MVSKKNRPVLIFCAHPDDEVIGPGGTIAEYTRKGIEVKVIIFSGGEMSNAFYKKNKLLNIRKKESEKAAKILGISKITYLGLTDMKLSSQVQEKKVKARIKKIIKTNDPSKTFTHAIDDMLYKDHKAVHDCVLDIMKEINSERKESENLPLYTFNIWTLNIRKRDSPKLVVNITKSFPKKIKALNQFKSQGLALLQLKPVVYIKALLNGWKNECRFAEEFYKVI
ncbi:MAG: PIG-L deacetylase family protein [Nanobdellota archaeon]